MSRHWAMNLSGRWWSQWALEMLFEVIGYCLMHGRKQQIGTFMKKVLRHLHLESSNRKLLWLLFSLNLIPVKLQLKSVCFRPATVVWALVLRLTPSKFSELLIRFRTDVSTFVVTAFYESGNILNLLSFSFAGKVYRRLDIFSSAAFFLTLIWMKS